jgi:phosphate transport system substrate-binding protein
MRKRSSPPPIVFILLLLLLLVGGWWFFHQQNDSQNNNGLSEKANNHNSPSPVPSIPSFPVLTSVTVGTEVRIDGSTSMVNINQKLQKSFQDKYPGTTVITNARGSERGIQDLITGNIDIAAVSRPLTDDEKNKGLQAVTISDDAIAIIVGTDNPFKGGFTDTQAADIFQGKITNWSQIGGDSVPIRVINRPPHSGTHLAFKELVLKRNDFCTGSNCITLKRDETTGLIQQLKKNGIGYATYKQVANQTQVRIVSVDGINPGASNYSYQRQLFYVYKTPANDAAKAFLGYATSPQVKQDL